MHTEKITDFETGPNSANWTFVKMKNEAYCFLNVLMTANLLLTLSRRVKTHN